MEGKAALQSTNKFFRKKGHYSKAPFFEKYLYSYLFILLLFYFPLNKIDLNNHSNKKFLSPSTTLVLVLNRLMNDNFFL